MASPDRLTIGTMDDSLPVVKPNASDGIFDNPRNNVFFRQSGIKTTLVGLKFPCALYFQGILEVNVICGSALMNGYKASAGDPRLPLRVFSMREGSAHCILATNSDLSSVNLSKFHPKLQPMVRDLLDLIGPQGCVICVSPRTGQYSHWKSAFRRHQLDVFPDLNKAAGLSVFGGAEKLLDTVLDVKDGSRIAMKLLISEELEDLSSELTPSTISQSLPGDNARVLLCGGKGVGKSSYLKYLINRYLSKEDTVLYVDLDIGQPEFTLSGCVSAVIVDRPLIGPNFTHSTTPIRSYFVGDVNPVQCLNGYLVAVEKLAKFCQSDDRCKYLPWFINTMGMTKSLGLDFLAVAIGCFRPHHVVQFNSRKPQDNFPAKLTPAFMRQFLPNLPIPAMEDVTFIHHDVTSVAKAQSRSVPLPTALKLREVVAVEFLSSLFNAEEDSALQLRELPDELKSVVVGSGMTHGDLVALCHKDDAALVLVAYGVITLQPGISVYSLVDDATFSNVDAVEKVPVKFKGPVILDYLPNKAGVVPNVCSFDLTHLAGEKKDVMRALFGLD